jgi:hypothetical protein
MMRRSLSLLPDGGDTLRRLVALPDCSAARVESITLRTGSGELRAPAESVAAIAGIERVGKIRDQTVALVTLDLGALALACGPRDAASAIDIEIALEGSRGPTTKDTGPFSYACSRSVLNYELGDTAGWRPPLSQRSTGRGAVTYVASAADCAAAGTDVLLIAATDLAGAPALRALALHHAAYLDLNVSIFSVENLPALTPEELKNFIQTVYDSRSSANFGDGHVGFVVLVGDAYADDNQTVMIPAYNGYGGEEVASDHYYACLSGSDDFEDVMIGRLSVGNITDLAAVVNKASNYMPVASGSGWDKRVLLIGGLFYTIKDDYVDLFDEYDAIIPDEFQVDRIYRHDFATDGACAIEVVDELNNGCLIANFAGDGWISTWDRTLSTAHIARMENGDRLPIVLSMACATGWFDNTTYPDANGSYDCLAEQLVNATNKGAIACLAAPRASDGGMFRTLTESVYRAVFEERCVFIGEAIAVGKLLHLQAGESVDYVRHFNLFGDPALIFAWDVPPTGAPDLALKPYDTTWAPELPGVNSTVTAEVRVANQSPVPVSGILVRIQGESRGGTYSIETTIPFIGGWASGSSILTIPDRTVGWHSVTVTVDPNGAIAETDESNNTFTREFYVYPHAPGFPVDLGVGLHAPTIGLVGDGMGVAILDEAASVRVVGPDGVEAWVSPAAVDPLNLDPEITPAVGDIDGDGGSEIVAPRRLGLAAFDADGDVLWTINTKDPIGYPALADANGDGISDIVVATYGFFGETSDITAFGGGGQQIWSRPLPQNVKSTASPAVADLNQDGRIDVVYGTNQGRVGALSTAASSPTHLWGPIQVSTSKIVSLALGDVDGDGGLEILVASDKLYCLHAESGSLAWMLSLGSAARCLALADVDEDERPEIVVGTEAGALHLVEGGASLWTALLSGRPGSSAAVADVNGDGASEVLVGTEDGFLHVLSADGSEWEPVPIPGRPGTPFAADVDGDGVVEVAVASDEGILFLFRFDGASSAAIEWAGLGRNAAHTGTYAQSLAGTITGSVTLSGEYVVTADVVVAQGATLTLAPGTRLTFTAGTSPKLEVVGTLAAAGVPGAEVTFRGSGGRAAWDGLKLSPGSVATLSSCRIEDASVGILGSLSSLTLNRVIADGNIVGMDLSRCALDAVQCTFSRSDSMGARLAGGTGTIIGSLFSENGRAGLICREGATHVIRGCTITGTTAGDGLACYRLAGITIDSCTITRNSRHGLVVKNSSPTVTNTSLTDNGQCGVYCRKMAFPSFTGCTIMGNDVGVYVELSANPDLGNEFHPESGHNWIEKNPTAAVANYNPSSVYVQAQRNWWGSSPPEPRIFIGRVAYEPWLTSSPMDLTASVGEDALPGGFALAQNIPNPFNPTTRIAYSVPAPGSEIELSVYDSAGRLIAALFSGFREAGVHEAVWNGRDVRGETVASGVYFARMDAPGFSSTRKLILLK